MNWSEKFDVIRRDGDDSPAHVVIKKNDSHEGNSKRENQPDSSHNVTIQCKAISEILPLLEEILHLLKSKTTDLILDDAALCKLLHISKKTSARYRTIGLRFSQPSDKKIFYRLSWIEEFIEKHSNESF